MIDGDTIQVRYKGKRQKVVFFGVRTPRSPIEPFGPEASKFTTYLLAGESVYLTDWADVSDEFLDKYGQPEVKEFRDAHGRSLGLQAYVYRVSDELFVNLEIIREGYGRASIVGPHKHTKFLYKPKRTHEQRSVACGHTPHGTHQISGEFINAVGERCL